MKEKESLRRNVENVEKKVSRESFGSVALCSSVDWLTKRKSRRLLDGQMKGKSRSIDRSSFRLSSHRIDTEGLRFQIEIETEQMPSNFNIDDFERLSKVGEGNDADTSIDRSVERDF